MNDRLLIVSYPAEQYSDAMDQRIIDALGKESCGSGMGFGWRDVEFDNANLTAKDAAKRLAAAGLKVKVTQL